MGLSIVMSLVANGIVRLACLGPRRSKAEIGLLNFLMYRLASQPSFKTGKTNILNFFLKNLI